MSRIGDNLLREISDHLKDIKDIMLDKSNKKTVVEIDVDLRSMIKESLDKNDQEKA